MAELVKIEDTELTIREYNGQRVVTLDDICSAHKCERKRLSRHFERKRKHFVENEDYYTLTRKELSDLMSPNSKIVGNPNIKVHLFTESGYLLVIKCLDDDLSWQVQRQLVNAYFKVKEQKKPVLEAEPLKFSTCRTSNTPVPRNPSFYMRNRRKLNKLCDISGATLPFVYHHLLMRIGEEYDMSAAEKIYENEKGHKPIYPMDIIDYFPELGRFAEEFLDGLIELESRRK